METNAEKYFIYARKSSEAKDRQAPSCENQVSVMREVAKREGLKIVKVYEEERSAGILGRPLFQEMMEKIYSGFADGILCWKLDRLSRNPVDGGAVSYALQEGMLRHIRTYEGNYYPDTNRILIAVELGAASQFIKDLSDNTKRGIKNRVERGWYPSRAPIGYLNYTRSKTENVIIPDDERVATVKRIFRYFLNGYSVSELYRLAGESWGLRARYSGAKLSRSAIYRMLVNPFYYGCFEYPQGSGMFHQGLHEPIISKEDHERVLEILGKDGRARPQKHFHAYTGILRCGECGCMITADPLKVKRFKNGNVSKYRYYHCTKKKDGGCSQRYIEEGKLEGQISEIISKIEIPAEIGKWIITQIKKEVSVEIDESTVARENNLKAYDRVVMDLQNLVRRYVENKIDEESYSVIKEEKEDERSRLKELIDHSDSRITSWMDCCDPVYLYRRKRYDWSKINQS